MQALKLIMKNALRHKLRTSLTVLGLVVATLSFGLLQTVVGARYEGANAAAGTRLITRNAISLVFRCRFRMRTGSGASKASRAWVTRTGSAASTRTRKISFRSLRSPAAGTWSSFRNSFYPTPSGLHSCATARAP